MRRDMHIIHGIGEAIWRRPDCRGFLVSANRPKPQAEQGQGGAKRQ